MVQGCVEDYAGGGFTFDLNNHIGGMPEVTAGGFTPSIDNTSLDFAQLGGGKRKRKSKKLKRSNKSRLNTRSRKSKNKSYKKKSKVNRKSLSKSKSFKRKSNKRLKKRKSLK
jgi:hypothetical protein